MRLIAAFFLAALVSPAYGEKMPGNLVYNGDFEKGKDTPVGWHVRLADFMPFTLRSEDKKRRSYFYVCGCKEYLGSFRPWAGLSCPGCKGFIGGEESGDLYLRNHQFVSFDKGKQGRGIKFTLSTPIGNNQGVRIYSRIFKVKPNWGYIMSFDTKASGPTTRVFAECFRVDPDSEPGSSALKVRDVRDWAGFCKIVKEAGGQDTPSPGKRLWEGLPAEPRQILAKIAQYPEVEEGDREIVTKALNQVLARPDFYKEEYFPNTEVPEKVLAGLGRLSEPLTEKCARGLNRHLLGICFRNEVLECTTDSDGCRAVQVSKVKHALERIYRGHVNCGSPANWEHFTKEMVAPKRYKFEWISVKLYAYLPGEAWFDNIKIRPMTKNELAAYFVKKPKYKDRRFEF